jgi:hypothetical protein
MPAGVCELPVKAQRRGMRKAMGLKFLTPKGIVLS